eukprot:CAMPEP_0197233956 /NCGR_PEP_ID=MMETSP1429-20130617/1850_1 /TAXON_ID=49237 /ORGANISM="Chaetoceros  sp., Strain UNC1202" /LENGTH=366 /DNA_ID=CAMNT_0042692275 /DNA_START=67 /DNA_END=1167 /DNA_ORIENTATION=-
MDFRKQVTEDEFTALRRQEDTVYSCRDYLSPEYHNDQMEEQDKTAQDKGTNASMFDALPSDPSAGSLTEVWRNASMFDSLPSDPSAGSLNEVWREKICEWCYQVVDHFDFSREVVSVSMSYLDRYLSSRRVNKKIFQLAAMTCLYLAIKLYEPTTLKISSLVGLSRGFFTADHIIAMEESILSALNWRMHPPTVMGAARQFLSLMSSEVDPQSKIDIIELSRFLSELSVCDYFFVTHKPSSIGLACILTAFEGVSHEHLSRKHRQKFVNDVYRIAKINCTIAEVHECRLRLRDIYERGNYHRRKDLPEPSPREPSPDHVARRMDEDSMDIEDSRSHSQFSESKPGHVHSSFVNTVSVADNDYRMSG